MVDILPLQHFEFFQDSSLQFQQTKNENKKIFIEINAVVKNPWYPEANLGIEIETNLFQVNE